MHIHEYQAWLQAWDYERGWDRGLLSHTLLHAVEEMGEVSKLVQMVEGYRPLPPEGLEQVRELLALELSDLLIMLFKVAYLCEIDVESALGKGMEKADRRFPDPSSGPAEQAAAWARFAAYLERSGLSAELAPYLAPLSPSASPSPALANPE